MIKIILSVLFFTNTALADAVIFSGNDVKTLKQNIDLFGVAKILSGSVNPSSGGGVAAPQGSIYMSTTVGLYEKTGAGNTAWTKYALLPVNLATQVTGILPVANGGTGTGTAFTSGSIVIADGAGVYDQDLGQLFWDFTNNRLGLGTSSPTSVLSFGGEVARTVASERRTAADTAGSNLTLRSGGSTILSTDKNGGNLLLSSGISTGTGTSQIQFFTAPAGSSGTADNAVTQKMTILGNGNVGIGIAAPGNLLTVQGTGATLVTFNRTDANDNFVANLNLSRVRSDATAPGAGFGNTIDFSLEAFTNGVTTTAASIGTLWENAQTNDTTDRNSAILFRNITANTVSEKMRITSSGNLGVGVTGPAARIHQDSGTATATAQKFTAGTTTGQTATDGFDVGIAATGSAELRQRENLEMGIFTNNTRRMTIDASGNVGIGVVPTSFFQVQGTVGRNITYETNGRGVFQINDNGAPPALTIRNAIEAVNNGSSIFLNLGYGGSAGVLGTGAEGARIIASAENIYTATASTQDASLRLFTSTDGTATEKMRITSSGQVGIGAAAPTASAKLDIQGTDGALLFPRLTTAQKNALTPAAGMQVYDTTLGRFDCYRAAWAPCGVAPQLSTAGRNALPDYFGQTVWNTDNSKLEVQQASGRWAPVVTFGSSAQTSLANNDSIVLNIFDLNQTVRVGAVAGGGVGISTDPLAPFLYAATKPDGLTVTLVGTSDTLAVTVLGSDTANGILAPDITLGRGQTATYRWEATLDRWILIGSSN